MRRRRWQGWRPSKKDLEREIDDEMQFHLEMRAKDFERSGLDRKAARTKAQNKFGDVGKFMSEALGIKNDHVRSVERARHWEEIRQDFRFGLRQFLVVRTQIDPTSLVASIRQELAEIDPNQPISDIRTTENVIAQSISRRRFNTILIGVFASMALILVVAGIYGVMSHFVSQRRHEIGVRVALGANRARVLFLVLLQGLRLAAIGLGIGLVGVMATTKLTESMVYGVSPTDPITVAGGMLFLVTVALLGSLVPARRATRVDPILALREE